MKIKISCFRNTLKQFIQPELDIPIKTQKLCQFEHNIFHYFYSIFSRCCKLAWINLIDCLDAAQQVFENPTQTDPSNDIAASISQAIQGLSAGAEGLQAPLNEEDLMKMFSGTGNLGSENDLLPFMQGKKHFIQSCLGTIFYNYLYPNNYPLHINCSLITLTK